MREILFRGKTLSNKQWVEGSLLKDEKGLCYIGTYLKIEDKTGFKLMAREQGKTHNRFVGMGFVQVDPETVCQFTGLTDKNGVKIFEGDILKGFQYPFLCEGHFNYFAEVLWFECDSSFGTYTFKNPESEVRGISEGNTDGFERCASEDWEVIGNIFDNPELMKGGGSDE